jgi:hypothetical protein
MNIQFHKHLSAGSKVITGGGGAFNNRMLRRICGHETEKAKGGWKKLMRNYIICTLHQTLLW